MNSHAAKAIWDFEGIYATSRHSERSLLECCERESGGLLMFLGTSLVPGVRFAGVSHPGLM